MSIIVTGGAGFIGSNFIINWLKETNEPVINVDCLSYAGNLENLREVSNHKRYTFIKASINDSKKISEILSTYQVRAIINFAAETHVDRSIANPSIFIEANILGVHSLLEAVKNNSNHKNIMFLQVSTDEVFGSLKDDQKSFTEVSLYKPNSPYSASKASADHLVRAYNKTYGLNTLIAHCSNNYGPRQNSEKLIPKIIKNAIQEKIIPIYGDGKNKRDWIFVNDHCHALRIILDNGTTGETYNIGGNCEKRNIEIASAVCSILDVLEPRKSKKPYSELITHVKDRPGHDYRYAINNHKISAAFGWKPHEDFMTGLRKTVDWFLNETRNKS